MSETQSTRKTAGFRHGIRPALVFAAMFAWTAGIPLQAQAESTGADLWRWPALDRAWLTGDGKNGYRWRPYRSFRIGAFGLPRPRMEQDAGKNPLRVLLVDGGEGFDPAREAYKDSLPQRLEDRLRTLTGRPVRVYYGGLPGIDSLRLFFRLRRLMEKIEPQTVLIMGIAADRTLNDPRAPFLPIGPKELKPPLNRAGLSVHARKSISSIVLAGPYARDLLWSLPIRATPVLSGQAETGPKITVQGGALRLVSTASRFGYQIASPGVAVVSKTPYVLEYEIDVGEGLMSIGAVDTASQTWIASKTLKPSDKPAGKLRFQAPSENLTIVLANSNKEAVVSAARIRRLALVGSNPIQTGAQDAVGPTVYSFRPAPGSETWISGNADATLTPSGSELQIVSDVSKYNYQFLSATIAVDAGADYVADYEIDVASGRMSLGVLDLISDKWVTQMSLDPGTGPRGRLAFQAPSTAIQLVISNNNAAPLRAAARVNRLSVAPRKTLEISGASADRVVYEFEVSGDGASWLQPDSAVKAVVEDAGLRIESDISKYYYQLMSPDIGVVPGTKYSLEFEIDLRAGGMSIGVLDAVANTWLEQYSLVQETAAGGTIKFTAPSKRVRIIISNNNAKPAQSVAVVRRIVMKNRSARSTVAGVATRPAPLPRPNTYRFEDPRIVAFSRSNLKAMVGLIRKSGAEPILSHLWWRDLRQAPPARRARHQARQNPFIYTLRYEEMLADVYDDLVREVGKESKTTVVRAPFSLADAADLAAALAPYLRRTIIKGGR